MTDPIATRRENLERDRQQKMREMMYHYDHTVYYPSKAELYRDCYKDGGHRGGNLHNNGLGWTWFYCGRCGGRYQTEGPDGETSPDSGQ